MFRGIVEGTAKVVELTRRARAARLALDFGKAARELELGQSVAVNGACLTVASRRGRVAAFDLAGETLARTNLGELARGTRVNFERAMRLQDRLDGHLVLGHVDGTGTIRRFERRGADHWLEIEAGRALLATMVPKGSVAVDGISLTLARLTMRGFTCTIVPHTLAVTNLATRRAGERVNLECDVLLKWMERLQQKSRGAS